MSVESPLKAITGCENYTNTECYNYMERQLFKKTLDSLIHHWRYQEEIFILSLVLSDILSGSFFKFPYM